MANSIRCFLFLLAAQCLFSMACAESAYEVTPKTPVISSPKEQTMVLADPEGTLSLEEALKRKNEFKPASDMGPIDAHIHYWIMQTIVSKLDADKELRLEGAGWLSINTSVIKPDGTVKTLKPSGFFYGNYANLTDKDPALAGSADATPQHALFMLHKGEALTLLSHSKAYSNLPPKSFVLRLVDHARYLETRRFGLYVEGAMLGILFALSIFGWFSFFSNKDRASLFYGLWISFAMFQIFAAGSQDGIHFTEFFMNVDGIYIGATSLPLLFSFIGGYGQAIFYFMFASAFLQFGKYFPTVQKIIYVYVTVYLVHAFVFTFHVHNYSPKWVWLPLVLFTLSLFVVNYVCGAMRYRQGMKIALFFLIGAIPYLLFRIIFGLGLAGIPSPFSYLPESGFSYLMQNSNVSQALGLCSEAIIMALAVVSRSRWIQQELASAMDAQKTLIQNQNSVLEQTVAERTRELEHQHYALDEAHQLVVGSVNYASRLQRGQLPRQMRIDGRFASFASIWEPRDTIGGDLYWLSSSQQSGPFVLAVADCTGHGVPGAMLSLLVSNSLERIYANDTDEDPASALMSLDHYVRTGLNQDRTDSESDDGCDAAVLRIDRDKQTIEFAGAKLGLFQVSASGEVTRHQAARCSLGYQDAVAEADKPVVQMIPYQSGDVFAVVTDGFTDQIGGSTGKTSFGYRRLEDILKANFAANAEEITLAMRNEFAAWQGANARRDDVTAVVFRL